ncbi:MAG TPA: hypothetical protein VJX74_15385 [Blastocatellia bacterium]|nr:hypothetical protein [Blastocatellia bacterium]
MQANLPSASAQGVSNSILEVVPTTSLGSVASGGQGSFFVEAQVFLNRTVNTSDCTVDDAAQESFFNGGNLVGTMRVWGFRTGASTGNATNATAGTQAINLTNTALAVVNISLDLPSFNGTIEMQGTLGRTRQNFENLLSFNGTTGSNLTIPLQDTVAITGGTGAFRGATGEATLTPLLTAITSGTATTNVNCSTGAFRLTISQVRRSNIGTIN